MKFIKKYRLYIIISFLSVLLLSSAAGIYLMSLFDSIQEIPEVDMAEMTNPNIDEKTEEVMKGYWTIALFGVDSRDGSLGKGNNADVDMICSVNRETGEIRLVSVYRDTYLKISEKGRYDKLNAAYLLGGPAQSISTLSENLDLKFDDYVVFNWKAVVDAINILGGVDMYITKDEFKLINGFITETVKSTGVGSVHLTHAGMNHLDGVQAVAYARLRKLDTDFRRTERQRAVLSKALEKARKADFSVINNIMVTVLPQTASSIDIDDIIPMAKNIKRYHLGKTSGFPFDHYETMIDGKDCVVPKTLESNVSDLHEFLFDKTYVPSRQVKTISGKITAAGRNANTNKSNKATSGPKATTKKHETEESTDETDELESTEGQGMTTTDEYVPEGPGVKPTKPSPGPQPTGGNGVPPTTGEVGPGVTTAPQETGPSPSEPSSSSAQPGGQAPATSAPAGDAPAPTASAGPAPTSAPAPQTEPPAGPGVQP